MQFKCILKRFGTILYKKHGDLLISLLWALGSLSMTTLQQMLSTSNDYNVNSEVQFEQSASLLNQTLHKEITKLSTVIYH